MAAANETRNTTTKRGGLMTKETYKRFDLNDATYWRADDVAAALRRSRSTIYKMADKGILPKPTQLTPRYSVWRKDEVLAAMEAWIAGQTKKTA